MTFSSSDSPQAPAPAPVNVPHHARRRPTLDDIRACQPSPMSEGWIGLIERQLSLRFSWLLVQTPVSANQITVLWLLLGVIGAALFYTGQYWMTLVGATLYLIVIILDNVDGEVARYKKIQSYIGVYLDLAGHNIVKSLLFIGISFGLYWSYQSLWVLMLGISSAISLTIGDNLRFYRLFIMERNNLSLGEPVVKNKNFRILRKLENLWRSHGLYTLTFIGALTNGLIYILIFYGIANPLWMLLNLYRTAGELRSVSKHNDSNHMKPEIIPD